MDVHRAREQGRFQHGPPFVEMRTPVMVMLFGVGARVRMNVGSGQKSPVYQFFG
jgi:hypothetical protein